MGYIDPGMFGLVSQVGYVVLFAVVSGLLFFFRPLKRAVMRVFKRQPPSDADTHSS